MGDARLDLAVIVPSLDKYGGAERVVVECVARWQHRHDVTLYAASLNEDLLAEHGIGDKVRRVKLAPSFGEPHAMLLNATLLPRIWHDQIGQHEVYQTHLWPTHLIDRHPMVWYPHEPFRAAHDLRYELRGIGDGESHIHIYPKLDYDRVAHDLRIPYLRAIDGADRSVMPERIIANSRYTASYLGQVYDRDVSDVVYPGAEPPRITGLARDPNLFVTVSQLWSHKRTRLLIEAIARTDEAQLLVIGSGPDLERLEQMTGRLGVKDRVFFLSGLRNDEMELILARACALLFAPIREPFGIVVLEAMAAGLPVIAADEGGYAEICTPESAFLIPPSPSLFAEKIALLQRSPDLRQSMGAAGRAAATSYTWSRTADEIEVVLQAAAVRRGSPKGSAEIATGRPLVGVQYYLWYGEGYGSSHWNDNPVSGYVADAPLAGYYGSAKGGTIDEHLDLFERMGLDYVILNLHVDQNGVNALEWASIEVMFERCDARGSSLRLAVQIVPYSEDVLLLSNIIAEIGERYAGRRNYLKLGDKPVLFWFWSGALDRHLSLAEIASVAAPFTNIAAALRMPAGADEPRLSGGWFDAYTPYSPLELADADNRESVWSLAYRLARDAGARWNVATISPGYDDSGLLDPRRSGNVRRVVARHEGQTYAASIAWVEALDPPPDLVMISTFNEYHENTHIEPSVRQGNRYLELTRAYVDRLHLRAQARA